jgi:nucleoside 2-deoxyribosyltransferase
MTRPKLKCFVASAFDRADVDAIFDKAIKPVLKQLDFAELRADRHEHNDDIDDKIFELLRNSDICIADLTYARPSVYYEAGYAFASGKPVVYIARSDHFRSTDGDDAGNLRVHFDLQMKNIIPWTEPNKTFKDRLCKRLKHVSRPILKVRAQREAIQKAEDKFASLSQNARLPLLVEKTRTMLYARGFKHWPMDNGGTVKRGDTLQFLYRVIGSMLEEVCVFARLGFTKQQLQSFAPWFGIPRTKQFSEIKQAHNVILAVSLAPVRQSTFAAAFPNRKPLAKNVLTSTPHVAFGEHLQRNTVVVIDSVKSVDDYAQRLKPALISAGLV